VRWYIEQWFTQLIEDLQQGIVQPILELDRENERANGEQLTIMAKQGLDHLRTYLDEVDPEFWWSYGRGKVSVANDLQRIVGNSFGPMEQVVSIHLEQSQKEAKQLKANLKDIQKKLDSIKGNQGILESRMQSLNSPFGPLPMSLPDLIMLFPWPLVAWVIS